jgi:hypothetical protein
MLKRPLGLRSVEDVRFHSAKPGRVLGDHFSDNPVFHARCRWTALESKHIWNFGGAYGATLVDEAQEILNEVSAFDHSFLHDGRRSRRSVSGSRAGVRGGVD